MSARDSEGPSLSGLCYQPPEALQHDCRQDALRHKQNMASFNFALISNFRVSKQTLKPNRHFLSILLLMKTQEESK